MSPTEFDDRLAAFRVFPVAFALAAAVLVGAAVKAHGLFSERAVLWALAAFAAALAVVLAMSPWRIHVVIDGASVEHTAMRLTGSTVTHFAKREVEAVEISRRFPLVVSVVLRDGRRFDALRPWDAKGAFDVARNSIRPRAEALAKSLGVAVRDA